MSINRRRRQRRARMIKHAGATGERRLSKAETAAVLADREKDREYRRSASLFQETQGKARPGMPQKSKLWSRHSVDMAPHVYGRRNKERGRTSAWGGHWLSMRDWSRDDFLAGRGLAESGRYALYVQGETYGRRLAGYHDDPQYALGWSRAASDRSNMEGVMIQCS